MRKVFVAGGAHTNFIGKLHPDFVWKGHKDFGKRENPHLDHYIHQAALAALKATGTEPAAVDRGTVGNFVGDLFDNQAHLGAVLAAAHKDLAGKPIARLEGACASGGLAFAAALDAIQAGADVVLVVGAEVQTTVNAKVGADYLARAADYRRQRGIDEFTFPCLFAKRVRAIVERTETTLEDCARVAVKAYSNANRNPFAHMHSVKMSLEQANTITDKNPAFLANPEFKEYLRVSDCSQVSDGGSAIVICSEEGLQRLHRPRAQAIELLANAVVTASIAEDPEPTALRTTEAASRRAYQTAGLRPSDIGVAEVHDCFTITEILMLEALGFADAGKGARLVREGATELGGRIPVNTGGGLVAFGHPVGATGVKQVLEVYRQMKGQCSDYQLRQPPRHGLCANMGGDDRTAVVSIFRNVE